MREVAFTPNGHWVATANTGTPRSKIALWPLSDRHRRHSLTNFEAFHSFHPDGSRLFVGVEGEDGEGVLMSVPITRGTGLEPAVLFPEDFDLHAADPQGRYLIIGTSSGVQKLPLDGNTPTVLDGVGRWPTLDPTGRYLASNPDSQKGDTLSVLDLETGKRLELEVPGTGPIEYRHDFDSDGRLLVNRGGMLRRLDRQTGATEVLVSEGIPDFRPIGDRRRLYIGWQGTGVRTILDLEDGSRTPLSQAHQPPSDIHIDPTGSFVVSGHPTGEIRVGPLFSEEYHLLLGHDPGVPWVKILDVGSGWIYSRGSEDTTYLWPMPDFSKPQLHTLPYAELTAKLKALTNLRAVPDETSYSGYKIEPDFSTLPSWADPPEW